MVDVLPALAEARFGGETMSEPKPHERVNDILFGPLERPALQWLAEHMPGWVTPDVLTSIGVAGSLMTFAG